MVTGSVKVNTYCCYGIVYRVPKECCKYLHEETFYETLTQQFKHLRYHLFNGKFFQSDVGKSGYYLLLLINLMINGLCSYFCH